MHLKDLHAEVYTGTVYHFQKQCKYYNTLNLEQLYDMSFPTPMKVPNGKIIITCVGYGLYLLQIL